MLLGFPDSLFHNQLIDADAKCHAEPAIAILPCSVQAWIVAHLVEEIVSDILAVPEAHLEGQLAEALGHGGCKLQNLHRG